ACAVDYHSSHCERWLVGWNFLQGISRGLRVDLPQAPGQAGNTSSYLQRLRRLATRNSARHGTRSTPLILAKAVGGGEPGFGVTDRPAAANCSKLPRQH